MPAPASNNELVRSNEEIQSAIADADAADASVAALDDEPAGLNADADADDNGRRPWEDQDGDQDRDEVENADTPARKGAPAVREFKANGKVHKVDMANQSTVDQLIQLGLGARQVFSERDRLKKANDASTAQLTDLQKYKDNWAKLEASKHDKAALYEKIFGTKWADDVKAESDWQTRYTAASDAEKRWMDSQRQTERDRAEQARTAQTTAEERAQLERDRDGLRADRIKGTMVPEFQRYEFSSRVKDESRAEQLNAALWRLSISSLKSQFGDQDDIPPAAIRKAFRDTHDLLWGQAKAVAKQEVQEVVTTKKKQAKEAAQVASTRNYGGSRSSKDLPTDPLKLFRKMFR